MLKQAGEMRSVLLQIEHLPKGYLPFIFVRGEKQIASTL